MHSSARAHPRVPPRVAQVRPECRVGRIALHGALERRHRLGLAPLLDQHQPEAVRRGRVGRLQGQRRLLGARGFGRHPRGGRRHRQVVIHGRVTRPARDEAAVDVHRLGRVARVLQGPRISGLEHRRVRIGARQFRQPAHRSARIAVRQPRELTLEHVPRGDLFRGIRRRIVRRRRGAGDVSQRAQAFGGLRRHGRRGGRRLPGLEIRDPLARPLDERGFLGREIARLPGIGRHVVELGL